MQLTLLQTRPEVADIVSFIFKPAGPLVWQAGQSVRLEITGPYGPVEHRFTISSPPSGGTLAITTRPSHSDYKTSLFAMQPGARAMAFGLEGDFVWRESARPPVFVAGGIGITPFMSMLAEHHATGQPLAATLIYSGRDHALPFLSLLDSWQKQYGTFALHTIIGEHLTARHITNIAPDAADRLTYISGPSAMVDALHDGLLVQGFNGSRILRDLFTGNLPLDI